MLIFLKRKTFYNLGTLASELMGGNSKKFGLMVLLRISRDSIGKVESNKLMWKKLILNTYLIIFKCIYTYFSATSVFKIFPLFPLFEKDKNEDKSQPV